MSRTKTPLNFLSVGFIYLPTFHSLEAHEANVGREARWNCLCRNMTDVVSA